MKITKIISAILTVLSFIQTAYAEDYTLFNPTPDNKLRSLNTERSSKSDYVTTVDAGRVQLETSLISVVNNKDCNDGNCTKVSQTTFGDTNSVRIGLTKNTDLQINTNLYTQKRSYNYGSETQKQYGFGDTAIRLKYSFSGNKGEKYGLSVTPFIKLPSNQNGLGNNDFEGGISIPFTMNLVDGWAFGGMTQFNFLKEQNNTTDSYIKKYYTAYANMVYVSKSFTDKISAFAEYYTYKADTKGAWWQNTADFGASYLITPNFKVDAGFNLGLTNAADDLNYYTGITYRF